MTRYATIPRRTGQRHTLRTVQRAREIYAAGWSLAQTADLVARELGVPRPSISTVHSWVKPGATERRQVERRRRDARATLAKATFRVPGHPRSPEWKFGRIRQLHAHGVDAATIARLMALDFGDDLDADEVSEAIETNRLPARWRSSEAA